MPSEPGGSGRRPDPDLGNGRDDGRGPGPETPPAHRTYDRIAEHFSETRASPWPEVEAFLADAPGGTLGLDLGCGNGRHVPPLAERVDRVVGLDASRALLAVAAREAPGAAYVRGDAAALPLCADCVDLAVYIATVHHLRPRAARVRSLDELARVLAPRGRALVSAWSTEHDRFDPERGFDTAVDWTLPDGETVPRYYHIYDPAEFRTDLDRSDLRVREAFVASGNCYAEVEGKRP